MDTPSPVLPPAPTYKDRRTGLIVFGIFEIMLGGFCLLMLPLTVFGQVMAARRTEAAVDFGMLAPTLVTFTLATAGLIWLGIGSIQARRWARALLLCFGWIGLCSGLVALVVFVPTLGSMDAMMRQQGRAMSPGALAVAKFFTVAMIAVIYVLIPGALVLFYRSRHVKLTCEQLDPVERWTDRCPLPVLAMCLMQAYAGVYLPMILLTRHCSAFPLAGFLVTGWGARVLWIALAGWSLYAARGFYRLQPRIWLIYTLATPVVGLSSLATFLRIGLLDYFRASGMSDRQLEHLSVSPLVQGHAIIWLCLASIALVVGYLLYLRRFFVAPCSPA